MTPGEAMQHALGYAAGREDGTGVKTADQGPEHSPGFLLFAEAYSHGWEMFNAQLVWLMPDCRSAYANWHVSGGRTIWDLDTHSVTLLERLAEHDLANGRQAAAVRLAA